MTWARYGHTVVAHLDIGRVRPNGGVVQLSPVSGELRVRWDSRAFGAQATIHGRLVRRAGNPLKI